MADWAGKLFAAGLALRIAVIAAVLFGVAPEPVGVVAGLDRTLIVLLVLLAFDVATYRVVDLLEEEERRDEVLALFWLSPLSILLVYWLAGSAIVAAAAMAAGQLMLTRRRYMEAGGLFGVAVALVPALVAITPLILLFAVRLAKRRHGARDLVLTLGAIAGLALLVRAATGTLEYPDPQSLPALGLPYGGGADLIVLPVLLTALFYVAWRARIFDERLLHAMVTLSLLAMTLVGGLSPALMLVTLPLLAQHSAYCESSGRLLFGLFSAFLTVWLVVSHLPDGPSSILGPLSLSVLLTLIVSVGFVILAQILQRRVLRAPVFKAHRQTMSIGVAGDSGVGKDTLSDGVAGLFRSPLVAQISGDDYHIWDRNKPMWRAMTHLNPKANYLDRFTSNVADLIDRRWVRARHYDHSIGRMTKPRLISPGEIVIVSGLHALWSVQLNDLYDLRVYLDMDEGLRRFLKIQRDVKERGHPLERVQQSIERRARDATAFIHPQKDEAQLILELAPRDPEALQEAESARDIPLQLNVYAVPGIVLDNLARDLVAFCGMQAVVLPAPSAGSKMIASGDPVPEAIASVAHRIAPEMTRLMRSDPTWMGGTRGVIQLVMLHQLEQLHRRRSSSA